MPRIVTPGRAYKHFKRYRQVISVLTKYGFGEFFGQVRLWGHVNIEKRILHHEHKFGLKTTPERMRQAMEELGPTFVKAGQMLSTRPDILPHNYIHELEKLQNNVSPIPTAVVKQIIEAELGRPINELFSSFNDEPLAAASLAQVHRATINGQEVVVKVQRPNIAQTIEVDLEIMHDLASLMDRYLSGAHTFNALGIVQEFAANIRKELNFRLEANNMRRFSHNFADTPWFHAPEVFSERYCTHKVLTMEYIDGINIGNIDKLKSEGYDLNLIAERGGDICFRSALDHGFFHADPHPGNMIILPNNVICLLDYGMMGTLSNRDRERLSRLLYFMDINDEKRTARSLLSLMESNEVIDAEIVEADISKMVQEFARGSLRDTQFGLLLFDLLHLLRQNDIIFPAHLIWLFKSIATLEDISRKMDPDFEMLGFAKKYAQKSIFKGLNPITQTREFYLSLVDSVNLIQDLPYDIGIILDQLKKGKVKIEFEHVGLEPMRKTLDKVSHHISLTLLLSSLLIASALIVSARIPPLAGEISLIGIAGFGISGILTLGLIITILIER